MCYASDSSLLYIVLTRSFVCLQYDGLTEILHSITEPRLLTSSIESSNLSFSSFLLAYLHLIVIIQSQYEWASFSSANTSIAGSVWLQYHSVSLEKKKSRAKHLLTKKLQRRITGFKEDSEKISPVINRKGLFSNREKKLLRSISRPDTSIGRVEKAERSHAEEKNAKESFFLKNLYKTIQKLPLVRSQKCWQLFFVSQKEVEDNIVNFSQLDCSVLL